MREVRLVALRLDPGDEILRPRAGNRLAADQNHRRVVDEADRLECGFRIVPQVGEQAGRREQRDVIDQDGGPVGRRSGNTIIGQRAAASDHVLDDEGLAERARHPLANEARDSIRAAAGRIGNHQRHRLGGGLRVDLSRKRGKQEARALSASLESRLITAASSPSRSLYYAALLRTYVRWRSHAAARWAPHDFRSC